MGSSDHRDLARTRLDAIARSARTDANETGFDDDPYATDRMDDHLGPAGDRLVDRITAARWDVGRRGTAALAGIAVLAALVAAVVMWRDRPIPEAVPPLPAVEIVAPAGHPPVSPEVPDELVVSVVGLVMRPGLVHLGSGARVADALDAAGGVTEGADIVALNLARRLADGDQIVVGSAPLQPVPHASVVSGGGGAAPGDTAGGLLDLNTADEAALDALPGVGPVTAAAIVSWRQANGPFTDVEQLGEVDGIGPARLARLRDLVTA